MITLECNYSKKIGLPAFSSHQFSVTLKSELSDLGKVAAETDRLYALLQNAVDGSIQKIGYLPGTNGAATNGKSHASVNGNGNGHIDLWKCSDKQKALVLQIIEENRLPKSQVEALARERFNTPVKLLNRLQASGLISELLEQYPSKQDGSRTFARGGPR